MSTSRYTMSIDDQLRELPAEAMMPWLVGFGDVQGVDEIALLIGPVRVVVTVDIPQMDRSQFTVVINERRRGLPPEWVVWWVTGVADGHGERQRLSVVTDHMPEDTRRMQLLQLGEAAGWFQYWYPPTRQAAGKTSAKKTGKGKASPK